MDTHTARFPQALKHFPLLLVFFFSSFFSLFFLPFYLSIDIFLVITHNAEGRTDGQRGGRDLCVSSDVKLIKPFRSVSRLMLISGEKPDDGSVVMYRRDLSTIKIFNRFFFFFPTSPPNISASKKRCMEKKEEGKKMCRLYLVVVGPKTTTTPSPERMKGEKTRENVKGGEKRKSQRVSTSSSPPPSSTSPYSGAKQGGLLRAL